MNSISDCLTGEPTEHDLGTESIWAEHGWALSGQHVAMLLLAVLIASSVMRVAGWLCLTP